MTKLICQHGTLKTECYVCYQDLVELQERYHDQAYETYSLDDYTSTIEPEQELDQATLYQEVATSKSNKTRRS